MSNAEGVEMTNGGGVEVSIVWHGTLGRHFDQREKSQSATADTRENDSTPRERFIPTAPDAPKDGRVATCPYESIG